MNARKLANWYRAIADAQDALAAAPQDVGEFEPSDKRTPEEQFADARLAARNIVLAGSGAKAELLGTLSTEPTATEATLIAAGLTKEAAAALLAEAANLRADAQKLVV